MLKSKPIIAVDVGDVLTASNEGVRHYINKTFGTKHRPADYLVEGNYHRYWDKVWGVSDEDAAKWYKSYVESDTTLRLLPIEHALETIAELQKRYDFVIVTSRSIEQIEQTKQWLDNYLPNVFKRIEFLRLHPQGSTATKAMILRDLNADYLIDDNLEHCLPAAEAGIQTLLFGEYGWSKGITIPENIVRVKNWDTIKEYFDGRDG